jgi:hypothetical protein
MLCLKTVNNGGILARELGEYIVPYDIDKIQRDCKWFNNDTVRCALELYKKLGLIYENKEGILAIADFDRLIGSQTYSGEKKQIQRANRVDNCPPECPPICPPDKDIEIRDKDNREINNIYKHIQDMFNDTCVSFPRLTVLSDKRKKAIKARLNTYSVEQFEEMFRKAEESSFLKGKNNRDWQATFDWLIADSNFAKVLDGNYDDKEGHTKIQSKSESERFYEALAALRTD